MPDQILLGRVALVSGGGSGIGAACVAALAAAGADVAIGVHGEDQAGERQAEIVTGLGHKAIAVQMDVTDEGSVEAAFDRTAEALGTPDILINSAGINMAGIEVADMALEQWQRLIAADLTGSFLTSRRFVRDLRKAEGSGAIVNITSIHAFAMRAGGADYGAAKGGQTNLTRTMALETARLGITVNAIAPGMILTSMNEKAVANAAARRSIEKNIPIGRAGRADEIARVALFLVSPDAAYITGTTIVVDGGLSLLVGQGA